VPACLTLLPIWPPTIVILELLPREANGDDDMRCGGPVLKTSSARVLPSSSSSKSELTVFGARFICGPNMDFTRLLRRVSLVVVSTVKSESPTSGGVLMSPVSNLGNDHRLMRRCTFGSQGDREFPHNDCVS
jgi:hypothetical protein